MLFRALLLISVVVTGGCGGVNGDIGSVFGNSQAINTLKNATSVTAYRLPSPSYYSEKLAAYEIASGPVSVPTELKGELTSILLAKSSYLWGEAKGCNPDYGVRFQFQHNGDEVDVLLCFQCDILSVYHNGQSVGGGNFDPSSPELATIVKAIFPDDPAIQSIGQ